MRITNNFNTPHFGMLYVRKDVIQRYQEQLEKSEPEERFNAEKTYKEAYEDLKMFSQIGRDLLVYYDKENDRVAVRELNNPGLFTGVDFCYGKTPIKTMQHAVKILNGEDFNIQCKD